MYYKLNQRWQWHNSPPVSLGGTLRAWLTNQGSLSIRLSAICEEFRVIVHQSRFDKVCPDEVFLLSTSSGARRVSTLVRDVSLICDDVPLVFGHSILMTRKTGSLARLFKQAGNNSLGFTLFAHPDINRGPIHFKRINRLHPLHAKSAAVFGGKPESFFWARRSVFSLRSEQICVTEVFSPQLMMFEEEFRTQAAATSARLHLAIP
jgi:chorismate--pyruvate lyase